MDKASQKTSGTAAVDGAEIYYEVRGRGPAVLMISGATGDAGHFAAAADLLASGHTVITYDRRGNSRSTAGVTSTSLDQQADDAAGLLRHLDAAPATVFGTSGGAIIAVKLALRTPSVARAFIVHEPPLVAALPDAADLGRMLQGQVEQALAHGGPRGAMELFLRENAGGDVFDRLEPALRERMLANGAWFFGRELQMFVSWVPDRAALAASDLPFVVLAGRGNRGNYHYRASQWLADGVGVELLEIPGTHAPYLADPRGFAAALHEILDRQPARAV